MGDMHTRMYREGTLVEEGFPLAGVSEHLRRPDTSIWIDLCDPAEDQLSDLAQMLTLHELAVEHVLSRQRPRLVRYDTHLFLSCHVARVDAHAGRLDEAEVNVFIGGRWLVTVRNSRAFPIEPVLERLDRSPDLAANGVDFLLYALLDAVVDTYADATDAFDEFYELLGESMFSEQKLAPLKQRQWFDMTRAMFRLHRLVVPMREVCASLVRREHGSVTEEVSPYFQDVHDHVIGLIDDLDSLREIASTIVETEVSLRDHRQNRVMKQVSSWAAIIAVPTLVTGYYGMNVPYPGSGEVVGVVTATGIMIVACIGLYHLFRRNQWL
jgi:magnesium transporter